VSDSDLLASEKKAENGDEDEDDADDRRLKVG
jgi:hypothetical protein